MERDREKTEEKLIDAVGRIIADYGFEALGVRTVADGAGVNKTLIYRYFGSLDGLIHAYMQRHDFWIAAPPELPATGDVKSYLKALYRRQIAEYRSNVAIKRLRRWELSSRRDFVVDVRARREQNGVRFMEQMAGLVNVDKRHLQAISAIIDAGVSYLAMLEENCEVYNGIDIQSDAGWEQLARGIDALVDMMMEE